ncbi:DUF6309 family protein [Nocardiopsis sp. NPDC006198]|uniref:DUF6309 family protein n=1 Tax=Nocardiopsis sp. NPDC006198 TaxID=3154472 RepID=UPI0033B6F51A
MKTIATVTPDDVLRRFRATHPVSDEVSRRTNEYAEGILDLASRQLGGTWHRVALDREDVLATVLPWHTGEGGELVLVDPEGTTVADAAATLSSWEGRYTESNPVCWGKLAWHAAADPSPVFLSSSAVDHPYYERLERTDALTHLDGLHRMLAWALWGRLPDGPRLEAYVAGPL